MVVRFCPLSICLLLGCGLGDRALVECRCTPETNLALFPACPSMAEVVVEGKGECWITAAGDTLDPEVDWIIARGEALYHQEGGNSRPLAPQIPDCPSGQRLALYEPVRPEFVLFNLRLLFEAPPESRNVGQYMDQLAQDFAFVPDEQDIQLHPEVYQADREPLWGRDQERNFAQAILDPKRIEKIRFFRWYESAMDERILGEDQRRETFVFPYEAEFTEKGDLSTVLAIKGWMEVDLVTPTVENPIWTIQQWRDRRDPATAKHSWGELRAEFAR